MARDIQLGRLSNGQILSLPLDVLKERHFAIQGATGQRKTLFALSLLVQFLQHRTHCVVYIDIGGDNAAYWILKKACDKAGKKMHLFSLMKDHDSLYFDPLVSSRALIADRQVAANSITQGLTLVFSEGYGRNYWGRVNQAEVNEGLDNLTVNTAALKELARELRKIHRRKRGKGDASEAVFALDQLLRYPMIGRAPQTIAQMNLGNIIERGDVVYFYLPAAFHGAAARAVATLAAWTTMVEAADRFEQGLSPRIVHIAVDEFSQIASGRSALESQLVLSRKWGVQMYLIYQSREQLRTPDGDIGPVLRDNCQRFLFTVASEEEQRELMACSKDELKQIATPGTSAFVPTTPVKTMIAPKLERNDILDISAKSMWAYGLLSLGDMHREPIPFEVIPPTASPQVHAALKGRPMPKLPLPQTPKASVHPASAPRPAIVPRHQKGLQALWKTKSLAITPSSNKP